MNHKVYYDKLNEVPRIDLHGPVGVRDVDPIIEGFEGIFKNKSISYFLNDVTDIKSFQIDRETRKALQERGKGLSISKIAVFGANPAVRMIARVVITTLGGETAYKFFKGENEAVAWLKGEKLS